MNIRVIITLLVISFFVVSCSITKPTVTQINQEPAIFMVAHPLIYKLNGTGTEIQVPVGFITDLASIPKVLWWWESPHERTLAPAILHDYLYWVQACSKDESDAVMYLAMKDVGMDGIDLKSIYAGIRTPIAEEAWENNKLARDNGEMRLFKSDYALIMLDSNIAPGTTLKTIQSDAMANYGMSQIVVPEAKVKKACGLALKEFKAI